MSDALHLPEQCDWCDDIVTEDMPGAPFGQGWFSLLNGRSDCLDSPSGKHEHTE